MDVLVLFAILVDLTLYCTLLIVLWYCCVIGIRCCLGVIG